MGKMNELAAELAELKRCGEVLIGISETLTEMFSSADGKIEEESQETVVKEKTDLPKEIISLEQVRAVLAEKSRNGFTAEVKAIITKHGADRLSDIDPAEFGEVLAEAEVLGNG